MVFGRTWSQLLNVSQKTKRYRKIMKSRDIETLQMDLNRLVYWVLENAKKKTNSKLHEESSG
jgi:spermidine/putrescine-binding protein